MARPRFHRLSAAQQSTILDAALREFAAHGFAAASLNRIIETAGVSKGAMYYYFDGKDDLYADVIRRQLERVIERVGPADAPDESGPDAFWAAIERFYAQTMQLLGATPETATLLRDWLTGTASPSLRAAQHDAEVAMLPWLARTIAAGQRAGAIRTDLPDDLLVALALGLGQAMDTWLITRPPIDLEKAVATLISVLRRAFEP